MNKTETGKLLLQYQMELEILVTKRAIMSAANNKALMEADYPTYSACDYEDLLKNMLSLKKRFEIAIK